MFYIISAERLLNELSHNAKGKGKGVLNWFIQEINGYKLINIIYDVYGIKYFYSERLEALPVAIKMIIDDKSQILGLIDSDSVYGEDESEEVSND